MYSVFTPGRLLSLRANIESVLCLLLSAFDVLPWLDGASDQWDHVHKNIAQSKLYESYFLKKFIMLLRTQSVF